MGVTESIIESVFSKASYLYYNDNDQLCGGFF